MSTTSARARRSSIMRMRASIMACFSLAASYSAFSEMSPCSRARPIAVRDRRSLHALQAAQLLGELLVTLSGHVHFLAQLILRPANRRSRCGARKPLSTRGRRFAGRPRAARLRLPPPRRFHRVHASFPHFRRARRGAPPGRLPGRLRRLQEGLGGAGRADDPRAPVRGRGPRVRARADRHRGGPGGRPRRDHARGPEPGSRH